jgi:hypothetical protein
MKTRTLMKAVRAKCLDCTCQQPKEVRLRTVKQCPLWPYRLGKRPKKEAPQELVRVDGEC